MSGGGDTQDPRRTSMQDANAFGRPIERAGQRYYDLRFSLCNRMAAPSTQSKTPSARSCNYSPSKNPRGASTASGKWRRAASGSVLLTFGACARTFNRKGACLPPMPKIRKKWSCRIRGVHFSFRTWMPNPRQSASSRANGKRPLAARRCPRSGSLGRPRHRLRSLFFCRSGVHD